MITKAIEKIEAMAKPVEMEIGGRKYTSKSIHAVRDPEPVELAVHTLTGLAGYIKENPDGINTEDLSVHIVSFDKIRLLGPLFGNFEQRKEYIHVKLITDEFPWGRWLDHEDFVIKLQSMFVKDETIEQILAIVGNIVDEKVQTVGDDGITQQVTKKIGIQRRENAPLPNPVTLTPYRTFLEAEQPASRFVFRMKSGASEGALPKCAFYEADGGRWKLDAIQNIKAWLADNVPSEVKILA